MMKKQAPIEQMKAAIVSDGETHQKLVVENLHLQIAHLSERIIQLIIEADDLSNTAISCAKRNIRLRRLLAMNGIDPDA